MGSGHGFDTAGKVEKPHTSPVQTVLSPSNRLVNRPATAVTGWRSFTGRAAVDCLAGYIGEFAINILELKIRNQGSAGRSRVCSDRAM